MPDLHMRADIFFEMNDGETREDAEDRLIDLFDTFAEEHGVHLIGWAGETEVIEYGQAGNDTEGN